MNLNRYRTQLRWFSGFLMRFAKLSEGSTFCIIISRDALLNLNIHNRDAFCKIRIRKKEEGRREREREIVGVGGLRGRDKKGRDGWARAAIRAGGSLKSKVSSASRDVVGPCVA